MFLIFSNAPFSSVLWCNNSSSVIVEILVDCETGSVVNEEEDLAESDGSIAESGDSDEEMQDMINYVA